MRQSTHTQLALDVQPLPDGNVALIIQDPRTGDVDIYPLPVEIAKEIGNKLAAPRVATAQPGQIPKLQLPR